MSEPSQESDFVNILTHLYSRKANRKTFLRIREAYKKETDNDLCDVIRDAKREIIHDINTLKAGETGDKLRTKAFKLIDYDTWLTYCNVSVKEGKKSAKS